MPNENAKPNEKSKPAKPEAKPAEPKYLVVDLTNDSKGQQTVAYGLPKDLVIGSKVKGNPKNRPNLWHRPVDKWRNIWGKGLTGKGVKIAVLDTGYKAHPDLPEPLHIRIYGNERETVNVHSNHVSSIALGRNGIGVAPEAELGVFKVLFGRQGSGSNIGIARAIRDAADLGYDIINLSLGGGGFDQTVVDAIEYANSKGCIVVAAAGNSGFRTGENSVDYPGRYRQTIAVAAIRSNGDIAGFSGGGEEVDVAAPGEGIVGADLEGGYIVLSGTSMSTPEVSGTLSLVLQRQRASGAAAFDGVEAVREFLAKYSDDAGAPGEDVRFGSGIPRTDNLDKQLAADDVTMTSV